MHRLTTQVFDKTMHLEITDTLIVKGNAILRPIAIYGDVVGSVIIISDNINTISLIFLSCLNNIIKPRPALTQRPANIAPKLNPPSK